jgi:hypothetical protein
MTPASRPCSMPVPLKRQQMASRGNFSERLGKDDG